MTPVNRFDRRVPSSLLLLSCVAFLAIGLAPSAQVSARQASTRTEGPQTRVADVEVVPVQGNVFLVAGGGGNVAVLVGPTGLVVVDTGGAAAGESVLAAIRSVSHLAVRYIINTSADPDHTGGNEVVDRAGEAKRTREIIDEGAVTVAHENVLNRMSAPTGKAAPTPVGAWPTVTFFTPQKDLYLEGQAIQVIHQPSAHTDGDSAVYFRRSDVLVTGDVFDKTRYPVVDRARGGSIRGTIDSLNRLLKIAVADQYEEGGTMIVPGHGRIADEADLVEYRDMVTIVADRVADLVKKGKTLSEVQAARPTSEFDAMYGASSGAWTTAMFVEAIYRDLAAPSTDTK